MVGKFVMLYWINVDFVVFERYILAYFADSGWIWFVRA
jgi:hypothetical protein